MLTNDTFLISGAGGFIGGWLAETLSLTGEANVRAGIRQWSSAARLARFPMDFVFFDVMDKDQIAPAMEGVTHVIHCASGSGDVIIEGTRNMLDVALSSDVERFIHISTTEVYGNVSGDIDETTPCQYTGHEYGDSKIEAEKLCAEFYAKGLPVNIIRPPIVYGPFSHDWTILIAKKLQSGNWGLFENFGEGYCNLIYIADLVDGILLALQNRQVAGETFNLNGPEIVTWNEYFRRFNEFLGFPELSFIKSSGSRLRASLVKPIKSSAKFVLNHLEDPLRRIYERSREARMAMQYVERSIKTTPTSEQLALYNRKARYISLKAQELLSYDPKFDVNTGLDLSVRWLHHLGLV
jgi:nucleoside-diphosphate-sugar epimerase